MKEPKPARSPGRRAVLPASPRLRVIITSDAEIDDECTLLRFLLYANEWDIEGIITTSSQYHWQGHDWAGDDWMEPYLDAYAQVYPNLVKHDARYPTPEYLRARTALGNVKAEGEMEEVTAGSQLHRQSAAERDGRAAGVAAGVGRNEHDRPGAENDRGGASGNDGRGGQEDPAFLHLGAGLDLSGLHPAALGQIQHPDDHLGSVRGDFYDWKTDQPAEAEIFRARG